MIEKLEMFNRTEWQFFNNLLQNLVTVKEEIMHTKNIFQSIIKKLRIICKKLNKNRGI